MAKRIRVGLYKLDYRSPDGKTIPDILGSIQALPDDETRAFMLADEPIRPRRLQICDEYCVGDFTRIRLVNELGLADVRGREDTIRFDPDGLHPAEKTAFLYDNESGCLHIQEGAGVTAASLGRYLRAVGQLQSVKTAPILKLDVMERFRHQRRFTLFKVKLAGLDDAGVFAELGLSRHELIQLAHMYRAPTASVQLQLDQREEGTLERIYETVSALLPLPSKNLKTMVVQGEGDEGEDQYQVDFIKDRMVYNFPVESGQEPTDEERCQAVIGAWQQHRAELRQRFHAAGQPAVRV